MQNAATSERGQQEMLQQHLAASGRQVEEIIIYACVVVARWRCWYGVFWREGYKRGICAPETAKCFALLLHLLAARKKWIWAAGAAAFAATGKRKLWPVSPAARLHPQSSGKPHSSQCSQGFMIGPLQRFKSRQSAESSLILMHPLVGGFCLPAHRSKK